MIQDEVTYCTYFDRNFLLKGLALHASLVKHDPEAKLWILAFDKYTEEILRKMKLKGVTVIPCREFEDRELLAVKGTRSRVEYIWTCTPSLPLYVFKRLPKMGYVCYLDADLFFYSSSIDAVSEIEDKSIMAVPHRFPKGLEGKVRDAGYFNVSFNVFKNDRVGIECLKRWRKQCLDWCYWKYEDGKLGDQMYLDEWPDLYKESLVISNNVGVDTAPWNVSQYQVTRKNGNVFIDDTRLTCYHFHQFQILGSDSFSRVLGYTLSRDVIEYIYKPYERELIKQYQILREYDPKFNIGKPENDEYKTQLFRQKLAKYFGPAYWNIKKWLGK